MTLQNAKGLYKHLMEIGRTAAADDILRRYPELNVKRAKEVYAEHEDIQIIEEIKPKPIGLKNKPKEEVKDDGKV